jgi:hypothetical protein
VARSHRVDYNLLEKMFGALDRKYPDRREDILRMENASRSSPRKGFERSASKSSNPFLVSNAKSSPTKTPTSTTRLAASLKRAASNVDLDSPLTTKRLRSGSTPPSMTESPVQRKRHPPDITPRRAPRDAHLADVEPQTPIIGSQASVTPDVWSSPRKKRTLLQPSLVADAKIGDSDVPRCATRRTLFVDREPWHSLCALMSSCLIDQSGSRSTARMNTKRKRTRR